ATAREEPSFSAASTKIQGVDGTPRKLTVSTTVTVPTDFRESQLALLLEPAQPTDGITSSAHRNGITGTVATENGDKGVWYWFKVDLKSGRNSIDFSISLPAKLHKEVRISGWLRGKRQLASTDL